MLLDRYDFYDLHAVLVAIRANPSAEYNAEILKAIISVLDKPQGTNIVEANIIRDLLKPVNIIDKELYSWVYINNAYTYGQRFEKNEFYYSVLSKAFVKLLFFLERQEYDIVHDLADALHNIPVFIADEKKDFKKLLKLEFDFYNKKYKKDLWKELTS